MAISFKKAVKSKAKARIGLIGPSGSGKTYTALTLATGLGKKFAVIDTEHGSASKYADEFEFDVLELDRFHPQTYIDAIKIAGQEGYEALIIDSLSHAWAGTEGALELADKNAARYGGNRFAAWRDVTPLHNKLIEAMLSSPFHLIVTLRSKMEYIQTQDDKGKTIIKRVGMQPIQRDGMEYEFDIVADMDLDHNLIVTKTRCKALDGLIVNKPGKELAETINAWLTDGAPMPELPKKQNIQRQNGTPQESTAMKEIFAKIAFYAAEKGYDKEVLSEKAREILRESYQVESCSKLTAAQWKSIAKNIEKLVQKAEERYIAEDVFGEEESPAEDAPIDTDYEQQNTEPAGE